MSHVTLYVAPADAGRGSGWGLECDLPMEAAYFESGGQAERAARALALKLSLDGHDVRLAVADRARRLIATQTFPAA